MQEHVMHYAYNISRDGGYEVPASKGFCVCVALSFDLQITGQK